MTVLAEAKEFFLFFESDVRRTCGCVCSPVTCLYQVQLQYDSVLARLFWTRGSNAAEVENDELCEN